MPPGFHLLIAAQFTSALADNALLIVTIALMQEQGMAAWLAPVLKLVFTLSYVLLAPFVGPLADAMPKGRLMAWMNAIKALGVLGLLMQLNPLAAYALVGLGAAGYAPAKYGLITEIVPSQRLVAANSWIEISVVCAALLGAVLGGLLVSSWFVSSSLAHAVGGAMVGGAGGAGVAVLLCLYAVAAVLQWGVPDSGVRYPQVRFHPLRLYRDFVRSNRVLWRDPQGALSLMVTTLFWGVGATLQVAVLRWVQDSLGLALDKGAYLQAMVALGVIVGAGFAGRAIALHRARMVLPAGIVLGLLISVTVLTHSLAWAMGLLAITGLVGGVLVVPMNALLQHRGHQLLTAGRSIAVQGYNENLSILLMLALYALLQYLAVPIVPLMATFGLLVAGAMALLMLSLRRSAHHA